MLAAIVVLKTRQRGYLLQFLVGFTMVPKFESALGGFQVQGVWWFKPAHRRDAKAAVSTMVTNLTISGSLLARGLATFSALMACPR